MRNLEGAFSSALSPLDPGAVVLGALLLVCLWLAIACIRMRTRLIRSGQNLARAGNRLDQALALHHQLSRALESFAADTPCFSALVDGEEELMDRLFRRGENFGLLPPGGAGAVEAADLLPGVRARLSAGLTERVELDDVIRIPSPPASGGVSETRIRATLIPAGLRTLVCLQPVNGRDSADERARQEMKVIRSILMESDLNCGLEKASALLHAGSAPGNPGFCVSLKDRGSGCLQVIWSHGVDPLLHRKLDNSPLESGYSPAAKAVLLSKEVQADAVCLQEEYRFPDTGKGTVQAWHSYPLTSVSGEVLGVFDVITPEDSCYRPDIRTTANFIFVATVLLERHVARQAVLNQARTDRLVKQVTETLLSADGRPETDAMPFCMEILQEHQELAAGYFGMIFVDPQDQLTLIGRLFTENSVINRNGRWLEKEYRTLAINNSALQAGDTGSGYSELLSLTAGEDSGIRLFVEQLPVVDTIRNGVWSVFPMVSGHCQLEGLLLFSHQTAITPEQNALLSILAPVFASYLVRSRLMRELKRRARHDPLTGLYNRGYIEECLTSEVARSSRYRNAYSVILFDIDYFKRINDTYGHEAGDTILKEIARRVRGSLRSVDLLGRWGGEEFLVTLAETGKDNAMQVAENIRHLVETGHYGLPDPVTVSLGVAQFREGDNAASLVRRADEALYRAKQRGRNQVAGK